MKLYLKVKPNQRLEKLEQSGSTWMMRVNAPPVDGKANKRVIELLSEILQVPKSKINLEKGHTSATKCFEIDADEKSVMQTLTLFVAMNVK